MSRSADRRNLGEPEHEARRLQPAAPPPPGWTTRTYRWLQRFFKKLPRRGIQLAGFGVVVVGIGWLIGGHIEGLAIVGTGCHLVAHPLERGPLLQVAVDLIQRRWG